MADIVLVGSDRIGMARMRTTLGKAGHQVEAAADLMDARVLVRAGSADILIIQVNESTTDEIPALQSLLAAAPDVDVVMIMDTMSPTAEHQIMSATQPLGVETYIPRQFVDSSFFLSMLTAIADRSRLRRANKRLEAELAEAQEQLLRVKVEDTLTGLPDYYYLQEWLTEQLPTTELSLMIVGIDNFEEIRREHGLRVAEPLLKDMAEVLRNNLRGSDMLTRTLAIDQFAIALPRARAVHAEIVANRLRSKLANFAPRAADSDIKISLSIGIVEANEGMNVDELLRLAEQALQQAQQSEAGLAVLTVPALPSDEDEEEEEVEWREDAQVL